MPRTHLAREDRRRSSTTAATAIWSTTPAQVYAEVGRARRARPAATHGPVHLCRTRHRLARQQQHRRNRSSADARRTPSRSRPGSYGRRHRRHLGHDRPLPALQAACTRLWVADVERSAFFDGFATQRSAHCRCEQPSRIEGIGRPRVEPSFVPGVIDHMRAACPTRCRWRRCGCCRAGSAAVSAVRPARNFIAMCLAAARMIAAGEDRLAGDADLQFRRALRQHLLFRRLAGREAASTPRLCEPAIEAFLAGGTAGAAVRGKLGLILA